MSSAGFSMALRNAIGNQLIPKGIDGGLLIVVDAMEGCDELLDAAVRIGLQDRPTVFQRRLPPMPASRRCI